MPIYRIIECEICGKKERLDEPYRFKWFIENFFRQICSKKCYNHQIKEELKREK